MSKSADMTCSPEATTPRTCGVAADTGATTCNSRNVDFPAPPPPPPLEVPVVKAPHENESTSIASGCCASDDSPSIPSSVRNRSCDEGTSPGASSDVCCGVDGIVSTGGVAWKVIGASGEPSAFCGMYATDSPVKLSV